MIPFRQVETNRSQPQSSVPLIQSQAVNSGTPSSVHQRKGRASQMLSTNRTSLRRINIPDNYPSQKILLKNVLSRNLSFPRRQGKSQSQQKNLLGFCCCLQDWVSCATLAGLWTQGHISPSVSRELRLKTCATVPSATWVLHTISSTPSSQWLSQCCVTLSK